MILAAKRNEDALLFVEYDETIFDNIHDYAMEFLGTDNIVSVKALDFIVDMKPLYKVVKPEGLLDKSCAIKSFISKEQVMWFVNNWQKETINWMDKLLIDDIIAMTEEE